MPALIRLSRVLAVVALMSLSGAAVAQGGAQINGIYNPDIDVIQQGASFKMFAEPGAPTLDVIIVEFGGSAALYRVGENTTLSEIMVLAGQVSGRQETDRIITESTVTVLRGNGQGGREVIYAATPEVLFREPGRHPQLQMGDVIEINNTYERRNPRITLREGLQIATSSLTLILTLYNILR
ncbi:MAG: hypothetical protein Rubg2KO_27430 [Rubricoccaceae bacterium]